ncbi:MAG: branched-chain amino acid ABC transporter permease [Candidatus Eremiobacteraeota bacterium]|nr:branched-chain amino acid ABC transporter permease [Candidatus Eremiobacteraeota bacterium]MBV8355575.1 branched-chain amino acid ABC transporter permease [Candidatus Eremiobacteraeota bacterium]
MISQQIANGVFLGATYALFAVGYTLIFGVLDILNLAHASIFMASAFVCLTLVTAGWPLGGAFVAALCAGGLLGVILDRVAFAPLRKRAAGTLVPLISSIGFAIVVEAVFRGVYGVDDRQFPEAARAAAPLSLLGVRFSALDLSILGAAIVLMLALAYLMRRTKLGRDIRAVADDRIAAALLGVDIERTIAITFFIASALGGAAGVLVGLQYNSVVPDMGSRIELKGLAVIILGGMGSITGAVIGGFILGITETLAVAFISSNWRDAIAFGVMFAILILRPTGLFGRRALRAA